MRRARRQAHIASLLSLTLTSSVAAALGGCTPVQSAESASPNTREIASPLQQLVAGQIEAWLRRNPVEATELGEHRYDGAWPDLSADGLQSEIAANRADLTALEQLDRRALSPADRVDYDIYASELKMRLFSLERTQPWRHNPVAYSGLWGTGLGELISRDYAPLEQRLTSVAERLEAMPATFADATMNLRAGGAMEPHARVALGQLSGLRKLIDGEIAAHAKKVGPTLQQRIREASGPALEALGSFEAALRDEFLPAARHPWRLGRDAFAEKLALNLQTDLAADEIYRLARSEHTRVRTDMVTLAKELAPELLTKDAAARLLAGPEEALVRDVLEGLATDHVTPAELKDSVTANLERLDTFVRDRGIIPLAADEKLEVIWTPAHQRGVAIAGLAPPGPLENVDSGLPSFYLVQPVPAQWSDAQRESFLREYNNFMLEILSIHEAIPGHFVQLYYGKREPSLVRRLFGSGHFIEGWAVYTERVMVEAGYAGTGTAPTSVPKHLPGLARVITDPALRAKAVALHGLKFYLRTVTNAILDHEIHAGRLDEEGALDLMVRQSFQQMGEAKAKWVRAQVSSTQLSTYFVGAQAWLRLRDQAKAQATAAGTEFDLAAFHAAALGHGAPPVHRLPELMGWSTRS